MTGAVTRGSTPARLCSPGSQMARKRWWCSSTCGAAPPSGPPASPKGPLGEGSSRPAGRQAPSFRRTLRIASCGGRHCRNRSRRRGRCPSALERGIGTPAPSPRPRPRCRRPSPCRAAGEEGEVSRLWRTAHVAHRLTSRASGSRASQRRCGERWDALGMNLRFHLAGEGEIGRAHV